MLIHTFWALLMILLTASLHGLCTVTFMVVLRRRPRHAARRPPHLKTELFLLAQLVVALLLVHCLEALIWAVYYLASGGLPDLETAFYFSLTSYTTIGYGDVVLAAPERLVGVVEGLAGTFMSGWSVALLVAVMQLVVKSTSSSAAKGAGTET